MSVNTKKETVGQKSKSNNGINEDGLMTEIIRPLNVIKKTNEITTEQVLRWVKRAKAQTV